MDWDKLKIFHAVAQAGSFTEASGTLNLSQSAISRQIQSLELTLKTSLFERHARGLSLTEDGEILFKTANEVIIHLKAVETSLMEKKDKPSGKLIVTTVVGFGSIWLTPRIKEFMDKYPEMEVEVIVTDKELDLSTREADVAIWMRQPTQLSYIQKKLIDINYHIYGSPKYLEENGYPNTVKDLDKHKFIVYGKGTPSPLSQTDWILKVGKKDSSKRKSVMRVNNIYSLLLAVESGVGLAALPYYMVQEKSTLVKVLPNIEGPKYEAHFVYPQSLKNVARIKSFRDFIFDKVNEWRF
ncbi:LysR family transcriptional regulator [Candidatus Pelagibacterales bacterium]|mgnify:FL=1|jgi:DNA-binding transcriptional LysR family regulator|nr:LysR family transcriptional regulator [Candidatus Fonsibacter sp.]GDX37626.1 LysR family transcriptional regulator [Pelagibacterales bacterium]